MVRAGARGGTGRVSYDLRAKDLILYRVSTEPPQLTVEKADANPQHTSGAQIEGLELVGYDLDDAEARPGGRLHLTLYWRVGTPPRALIATSLGGMPLEAHQLGLTDLRRYVETVRPDRDELVVEDYWIVLPYGAEEGTYPLQIALQDPFWRQPVTQAITLQEIEIGQALGGHLSALSYQSVSDDR